MRPLVDFQHIFHAGYEGGVGLWRNDPSASSARGPWAARNRPARSAWPRRRVEDADQKAAQSAQRRGDGKRRGIHLVRIQPHLHGGFTVLRRGAHRPAMLAEAKEAEQYCGAGQANAGDQDVECPDGAAADLPAPIWARRFAGRGSGLPRICISWSSTRPMPMVASRGAMRAVPANGRSPTRSMTTPSAPHPTRTMRIVTGSGACR